MTATDTTYNGWTNYETWNVALWLDNEEGTYRYVRDELAVRAREQEADTDSVKLLLADSIEEMVKDGMPDLPASTYLDLLGAALSEVNWWEIAENVLSED